jgi:hypothetical protein
MTAQQEYLEYKLKEIEKLQAEVDKILYSKNPFVRFFYFNKACKLHLLASEKMKEFFLIELIINPLDK